MLTENAKQALLGEADGLDRLVARGWRRARRGGGLLGPTGSGLALGFEDDIGRWSLYAFGDGEVQGPALGTGDTAEAAIADGLLSLDELTKQITRLRP